MSTKIIRETIQENKTYDNNQQNNADKNIKEEIVVNKNEQRATWGTGQVTGGRLYCRKQPSKSAAYWGQFANGATIPIKEYNSTWYETYWNNDTSKTGYVMSEFVTNEDWNNQPDIGGEPDPSFPVGYFGKTTQTQVRVRNSPGSNRFTQVVKGSLFYIEGTEDGPTITGSTSRVWVKIRFGKGDGTYVFRYIHSSCFGDTRSIVSSAKTRIVSIAKSMVGNTGGGLGLSGDWCQKFIYWLCASTGMEIVGLPYTQYLCGKARLAMIESKIGTWHERGDGYIPLAGDLIYYGDLGSPISSHVGLVVVGGNSFNTVEGNMGTETNKEKNKVKLCTGSVSSGQCNGKYYQGFVTLNI